MPSLNPYIPKQLSMVSLCRSNVHESYVMLGFKGKRDCLKHEDQFE